jgi:hypothetical protein
MSKFKVGDRVRVRKPADVMQKPWWTEGMDRFDGSLHRIRELVTDYGNFKLVGAGNYQFHPDWLGKVDPVEPIRSWVPQGYSVIEIAVPDAMREAIGEGNALVWKKPNRGQRYFALGLTTNVSRADFLDNFHPVITPTTPPAPKYREPTQADVGRMVEVRDSQDHRWENFELLAVIRDESIFERFVCRDREDALDSINWTFARIKIEEPK